MKSKAKASHCCLINDVERYGRQGKIRTAPNGLIIAHDLFGMRVRVAEVMTNMDVKKQFGQRLFSEIQLRCQGSVACSQITAFATTVLMAGGQRRGS